MRDVMNLVAKEYVAAQDPLDPGVLILSKFAGAAQQLTGALIVNPNDKLEVAEAIRDALKMSHRERVTRVGLSGVVQNRDFPRPRAWGIGGKHSMWTWRARQLAILIYAHCFSARCSFCLLQRLVFPICE
jgi:hypothetical protein